ncbi:MAG: outer membrane protein assembly factor BamD [Lewinellaceae bacterium]|nr:outer membrane protein assembly factor BamD [Saprospiraceae bacterium]MCB9333949.1 outer membrane protein assembly factor BamD [Lewinellaceae bacterium]
MKKTHVWLLLAGFIWLCSSCKSEFEKIRISGNQDLILNKAFEYYEKGEYQRAQTLFDLVLNTIRGSEKAEKAYFEYAYTYYHLKQYMLSAYYFKNFSNTFTNSNSREEAAYMSAYSNYLLSPSYRLEQSNTKQAIDEFQLFANLFPKSPRIPECNKLIDELRRKLEQKAFAEGELYFDLRQYQSAVISFDNLLRDYPESPDAERVRYLIAKSAFLLSKNSVIDKKLDRYIETVNRCNAFLDKYQSGKYNKEIKDLRRDSEDEIKVLRKRLKVT